MSWPALYNRYPLLYPDSMTYLEDGHLVARALFLHRFSDYYGMRSLIYSLGILPWHWNISPWPIVALHALLAASVIWLVVRSVLPVRTTRHYLVLVATLSLLTSLSWFVSLIMPDILGPLLYLCIYLLVFARETLSRLERLAVTLIAWWAMASHITHLLLAAALCVLLLLLAFRKGPGHPQLRAVGQVAAVVVLAATAHLLLHWYLYGEPSLNGERPPYLTARIIADGPGRWYLEQHCGEARFVLCEHLRDLPDNADDFLWDPSGILQTASEATEERLRAEEMQFVLATLRTYPRQQLSKSIAKAWQQLTTFDLWDLGANSSVPEVLNNLLPGTKAQYLRGRQASGTLPLGPFTTIQMWTVIASLALMILFAPFIWRLHSSRLAGLSVMIIFAVVVNACVTGPLSMVEDRFQGRVIWLLPLLAAVFSQVWREHQRARKPKR